MLLSCASGLTVRDDVQNALELALGALGLSGQVVTRSALTSRERDLL